MTKKPRIDPARVVGPLGFRVELPINSFDFPPGRGLPDGVPCTHPGCLSHVSHPCEGCGRVGGRTALSDMYVGSCGKCYKTPEEHYKDKQGQLWCVGNVNEMYEPIPIYYPAECKHGKWERE